ncbi:MAG: hypothetical protein DMG14_12820 [Acidobacteria bacterium]|nr:MAG: hypothetical protein DMG14_12820 [Acidobacteriota bacterium]
MDCGVSAVEQFRRLTGLEGAVRFYRHGSGSRRPLWLQACSRGLQPAFRTATMLRPPCVSDIMSDMKTVTLRSLLRDSALLDRVASGEEILVTRFGKPYVRIVPAEQPQTFLGAGKHLRQKKAVSPKPIPASEWKGLE